MKKLRLLSARAQTDLLVVIDYGYRHTDSANGWAAMAPLIIPMFFVPMRDVTVESYVDSYVIDTRNGYLYGHVQTSEEKTEEYVSLFDPAHKAMIDDQFDLLMNKTGKLMTNLLAEERGNSLSPLKKEPAPKKRAGDLGATGRRRGAEPIRRRFDSIPSGEAAIRGWLPFHVDLGGGGGSLVAFSVERCCELSKLAVTAGDAQRELKGIARGGGRRGSGRERACQRTGSSHPASARVVAAVEPVKRPHRLGPYLRLVGQRLRFDHVGLVHAVQSALPGALAEEPETEELSRAWSDGDFLHGDRVSVSWGAGGWRRSGAAAKPDGENRECSSAHERWTCRLAEKFPRGC